MVRQRYIGSLPNLAARARSSPTSRLLPLARAIRVFRPSGESPPSFFTGREQEAGSELGDGAGADGRGIGEDRRSAARRRARRDCGKGATPVAGGRGIERRARRRARPEGSGAGGGRPRNRPTACGQKPPILERELNRAGRAKPPGSPVFDKTARFTRFSPVWCPVRSSALNRPH
ncbi:hypothetical protein BRADI_4g43825v3 [Brachypodium distachyon]|uniref:Uncharacterized protein n=1 Tax=Brachypodium distachyon TaxID=15368 RepID=A0A2K2CU17_BRADI|nr:hypothetical protein BRADI_4g43825v3 [Brachypodium distachyon]